METGESISADVRVREGYGNFEGMTEAPATEALAAKAAATKAPNDKSP